VSRVAYSEASCFRDDWAEQYHYEFVNASKGEQSLNRALKEP
jgi:hypothetical protein